MAAQKTKRVDIRLTPTEYDMLKAKAAAAGYGTIAKYFRATAINGQQEFNRYQVDFSQLGKAVFQLSQAGNNCNQIVHAINRGYQATTDEINESLSEILDSLEFQKREVLAIRKALTESGLPL